MVSSLLRSFYIIIHSSSSSSSSSSSQPPLAGSGNASATPAAPTVVSVVHAVASVATVAPPAAAVHSGDEESKEEEDGAWQVLLDTGWRTMDLETQRTLSNARASGGTRVTVVINGNKYAMNLTAMQQINVRASCSRSVSPLNLTQGHIFTIARPRVHTSCINQ